MRQGRALRRFSAAWLAALCCGGVGCSGSQEAWFADEAAPRGIDFRHRSGFRERRLMPEIMGSGAALADLDGDGDLDAYLVQGGSLYADAAERPGNRLYFNRGDGVFEPAPAGHGAGDAGFGMGVAAGDYDNDGDVDLYVTNVGANALLSNDGEGRFANVAAEAGVADAGWGTAAAFLDLDQDGYLDLFLVNYVLWSAENELTCYVSGVFTYCPPQNYNAPAPDRLFRNDGDGTFTDVSVESGVSLRFGNGLGVVGADFNDDGRTDVFVANDMLENQLWINESAPGALRMREDALLWGCAVDGHGAAKAGMGVAAADADDDGDADLLVVNLVGQTDSFFRNQGGWFDDATAEAGLAADGQRHTRFGVALADFDNDGRLDVYQANGRINPGPPSAAGDEFAEPNLLLRGGERGFERAVATGEPRAHTSRGLALGDVDDDGGLDLLVINRDAPPYLLMNRAPGRGNWVRFRAVAHGRDAHGATVSAVVGDLRRYRDVNPSGSYLAANDPRVHFGLGAELAATDVKVRWPTGEVESFGDFAAGDMATLRRGAGAPAEW